MTRGDGDCDVLIVGGGPVGSALALAIAGEHCRVTVAEAQTGSASGDARATVLAAATVRLLRALDAWAPLAADAAPVRRVEVSSRGHFGRTRLDAGDLGVDALGYVVSHRQLTDVLARAAAERSGVEWLAPARVRSLTGVDDARRSVVLDCGDHEIRRDARLVVGADGTGSRVRQLLEIGAETCEYGQTAILLDVAVNGDPCTAHERFLDDGALALLPAGGRRRTAVWTMSDALAASRLESSETELGRLIAARLGRQLQPLELLSAPRAWPLRMCRAERVVAARAVLAGNAALTLHPVAAQGFNLAMRDICGLAEMIVDAHDPGDPAVLERWDSARKCDRVLTRSATDGIARAFGEGGAGSWAVSAGLLTGLDVCAAGRRTVAGLGSGLAMRLPRVGNWRPQA